MRSRIYLFAGAWLSAGACSSGAGAPPQASSGTQPAAGGNTPATAAPGAQPGAAADGNTPAAMAPGAQPGAAANGNTATPPAGPAGGATLALTLSAPAFDPDAGALGVLGSLEVSLVEAAALLADGAGEPRQTTPLPADACAGPAGASAAVTCTLSLAGVDPAAYPQGAAIRVRDARSSPQGPSWTTLYSYLGADKLAAATADRPVAVDVVLLSSAALDMVATWAGMASADLAAHGAVVGTLRMSAASPVPLAGATIKPSQSGLTVGYGGPDGHAAAAPTSALGMFVATPRDARPIMVAPWRIVLPGDAGSSKTPGPAFGATGKVISALTFVGP